MAIKTHKIILHKGKMTERKYYELEKGDVVCDKKGNFMLVCCSAECGVPMLAYRYEEHENGDRGTSFKYVREDDLEYIGRF